MVRIRDARQDDIDEFKEVVSSSVTELCKGYYTPVQLEALLGQYPGRDVYTKWLKDRVLIVAIDENDIVGFAQFDPSLSSIEAVHVSPKHAGRGIGRNLVNEIEKKARSLGICKVTVDSSLNAVAFYSKCGYLRKGPGKYRCKSGIELETEMFEKGICGEQTL